MTQIAQSDDFDAIGAIYKCNHPNDEGRLTADVRVTTETFVARDQAGKVIGFAMISVLNCGVQPYGIIHQLEVTLDCPARDRPDVRQSLVEACASWLQDQGVELMYARTLDKGSEITAMFRFAEGQEWTFDPAPDPGQWSVPLPGIWA